MSCKSLKRFHTPRSPDRVLVLAFTNQALESPPVLDMISHPQLPSRSINASGLSTSEIQIVRLLRSRHAVARRRFDAISEHI